jgi:hypothetical protein
MGVSPARDAMEKGRLLRTFFHSVGASLCEGASFGKSEEIRGRADDRCEGQVARRVHFGKRGQEALRVRVARRFEEGRGGALFDDFSSVKDEDPRAGRGDDVEIVRDEEKTRRFFSPLQKLEDLSLHRHIESRCRLIGDEKLGRAGESDGERDSLAHPAA